MRLGIVTDIHNNYTNLSRALEVFRNHQVDQVVTIGDTCDAFKPVEGADAVASLLAKCGAVGVWGNHDFHLCRQVSSLCRAKFAPATLDFMGKMQPQLEIDGCYFSHKDASIDPHDVEQLWGFEEEPLDLWARSRAAFAANQCGRQFMGHYHCWWAATPSGPIDWDGSESLTLMPHERYVVIIAGVFQGKCALLDTATGTLDPLDCTPL
ncbi:MAG: metallophosphoesterase family protein [Microcoleus sp. SU_5_3]|nr:metallophosphoesterase family protein [Microcoleus sp. SU_5_3]